MTKCNHCQQTFSATENEITFREKLHIPNPTLCPTCRYQRRLAFRNERNLYKRKCDATGKDIISIYSPEEKFPVYEPTAWFSDNWNDLANGRNFDFNKPFFEQFKELESTAPKMALHTMNLENSPFVNQCWYTKNSYMCFDMGFVEDALYCYSTHHSKNITDSSFTFESELSYYLIDCRKCYQCTYLQNCIGCLDSHFSFDCHNCNNIAFCNNLRNKSLMLFNKKVSKKEFDNFMQEFKQGSYRKNQEYMQLFKTVLKNAIRRENNNLNVENCTGDYIQDSKNCDDCYNVNESQDLQYCARIDEKCKDCIDVNHASQVELALESTSVAGYNLQFGVMGLHSNNCMYFHTLKNCSNCFGCISLKNKSCCILNKKYSQQEYEELMPRIINHMQKTGEWGEFFPISISPFAYNETCAQDDFPLSKEEAVSQGYKWKDQDQKEYHPQTYEIPDRIVNAPESITKEILACSSCSKNHKIISQELKFYKNLGLPIPRKCPSCRNRKRIELRNSQQMRNANCFKCGNNLQTGCPPTQKIYCEKCYLGEIY